MICLTPQCRDDVRMFAGVAWRLALAALIVFIIVEWRDIRDLAHFSYVLNQIQ